MFELGDLEAQALQIDSQYRAAIDKLAKDDSLSMSGKVAEAQRLDVRRRDQVAHLQQQARDRHAAALEKAQATAQAARAADVQRKRQLLGDVAMLRLYERQVSAADSDELLALIHDSAEGYERELLTELARVELFERTGRPDATRADIDSWQQLKPTPAIDYELKQAGQRIEALDLAKYRASMADSLGVDSRYVPAPQF